MTRPQGRLSETTMRCRRRHPLRAARPLALALGVLVASALPASTARAADRLPPDAIARAVEGRQALESGDLDTAISALTEATTLAPDAPALDYNLGVALFRADRFDEAAEAFERARTRSSEHLGGRASYNLGDAAYAAALRQLAASSPAPDGAAPAAPDLGPVIEQLDTALDSFRRALRADPTDADARTNAETAHRLRRMLQEQQQQQQQQQDQQQNEDEQEQQDQQDQDEQEQQDQQDQDQQEQQDQQGQDEQEQQDQQNQDQQEQQDQQGQDEQEQQDQQNQDEQEQQNQQNQDQQEQQEQRQEPRMTQAEAQRLLQAVRDKERQRRAAQLAAERARRTDPVEKDW